MTDYVLSFIFHEDRRYVLLVRKNRPAWQAGKYNGIGGKIEANETAAQAAARELKEEADIDIDPTELTAFGKLMGTGYQVYLFAAELPHARYATHRTMTDEIIESWRVRDLQSLHIFTPDDFDRDLAYLTAMARLALEPGQSIKAVIAR